VKLRVPNKSYVNDINPLNAELYPVSHLLALLGVHIILHVSRIRVKLLFMLVYIYIVEISNLHFRKPK